MSYYSKYEGLQPVYTEYNIGHYVRTFQISSKIQQGEISAELKDGVMTLVLPKAERAKPRKIKVSRRNKGLSDETYALYVPEAWSVLIPRRNRVTWRDDDRAAHLSLETAIATKQAGAPA